MTHLLRLMFQDLRTSSERYALLREQFEETKAKRAEVATRIDQMKKLLALESDGQERAHG